MCRARPSSQKSDKTTKWGCILQGGVDRILGVDFSGARDAGRKLWLTVCVEREGKLHVKSSVPAGSQFGAADRGEALAGLREAIVRADVVGIDFPFGLPARVHGFDRWGDACEWVVESVEGPEDLRRQCVERTREGEPAYCRRATDEHHGAPSPYHWVVAAKTYYGITNVLWPLLERGAITARPMQDGDGTPVCEVSPTGTLADVGLPTDRYTDDLPAARDRRETIVEGLQLTPLSLHGIEDHLIDDVGGDAIDSALAALAAWRASREGFETEGPYDDAEGHIYV